MKRTSSLRPCPALPPHGSGQRIGLLGGSFNPAHEAHRLISLIALRRLRLDAIWWLVTPGNPLKDVSTLPTTAERVALANRVAHHPRIHVTGIEEDFGTRFTFDTLSVLRSRASKVHFVWLMGADNLQNFHRWNRWRALAHLMPIAVIDRPGATHYAARARAAVALEWARLPEHEAQALFERSAPAFTILHDRRSPLSSSFLRERHIFADNQDYIENR